MEKIVNLEFKKREVIVLDGDELVCALFDSTYSPTKVKFMKYALINETGWQEISNVKKFFPPEKKEKLYVSGNDGINDGHD